MKQIYLVLIITTQLLVTSCGGLQRARVYIYTDTNPDATTKSWGDGLATADNDVCIWVNRSHGGYDVMWAGPIFLPVMPIGAAAEAFGEKLETGDAVLVRISIFPADTTAQPIEWTFDPANIFVEFENGDVIQPASFAVHRNSTTSDDGKGVRNKKRQTKPIGQRKPLFAHPTPKNTRVGSSSNY